MKNKSGFIALISILIISVLVSLIVLGFAFRSINEAVMSLDINQSLQAYFLANLCAEQALMKLKEDLSYTGNEIISTAQGNCQILPIENTWIVKTIGSFQNKNKKMKIVIKEIHPKTIISSWEQVPDF